MRVVNGEALVEVEYILATMRKLISISRGNIPTEANSVKLWSYLLSIIESCGDDDEDKCKACFELVVDIIE
jgi:hypothetical protein